jgi:NAD(P)-dependent dehydrogenase (short-subunit alcohol dehydrogenase family)
MAARLARTTRVAKPRPSLLDARRDGAHAAHRRRASAEPLPHAEHAARRDEPTVEEEPFEPVEADRAFPALPAVALRRQDVEGFALELPELIQVSFLQRTLVERHGAGMLHPSSMSAPRAVMVIGGTRNLGHDLVHALCAAGAGVTVLNRGRTPDALPSDVERLRADRSDRAALAHALAGRTFDAVVDTTLYVGADAEAVVELLDGRVGRYVWLSTGQVYLVRPGLSRPFRELDYAGALMPEPARDGPDWADWRYGVDKRGAEDVLERAWRTRRFPVTTLRLPMVNSRRDHFARLLGYVQRLRDGGPILVPDAPDHALRHVDGNDVVTTIAALLANGRGIGEAYNLSQDETLTLDAFVGLVAAWLGVRATIVRVSRARLDAAGLLMACSPFSDRWMSELDNTRSRADWGSVTRRSPNDRSPRRLVLRPSRDRRPRYAQRPRERAIARELGNECGAARRARHRRVLGIGAASASLLATHGFTVVGTSRRAPDPAPAGVSWIAMDVRDEASVDAAVRGVLSRHGRIDVLVCNAGFGIFGAIEDVALDRARAQFETNVFGTLAPIRAILPAMRAAGGGRIVVVGSLAGRAPIPFQAHYSMTKSAVDALVLALRMEVRHSACTCR